MRYGRAIAVAGLMLGLVGLASVESAGLAQTVDPRKAEGDQILRQGIEKIERREPEAALQTLAQAVIKLSSN
ncbi:MAG: hypothetical protein HC878_18475 [Leptolyngbyaceae cyanobacterium SL_5_14]|nr:hypothetical protein [Leptolyngbyaceae cyanobacterium SL_5_14]